MGDDGFDGILLAGEIFGVGMVWVEDPVRRYGGLSRFIGYV